MLKVPRTAWSRIDATINRATREFNAGVPDVGRELPQAYGLATDRFTKVVHVAQIRFPSGVVTLRRDPVIEWRKFA